MNIGQMFLMGFTGPCLEPGSWLDVALEEGRLGGVLLFDRNVRGLVQNFTSPAQLQDLTAQLQERSAAFLLIAVDQEGGKVCRLKEKDGFLASYMAAELGQQAAEQSTAVASAALAAELARYGINFNLAPVADVDLNPANPIIAAYGRSFSKNENQVAEHCRAFIAAHHSHNIACCLKHFPGHGSAQGDSHLGFVDISQDWQEKELEPYQLLFTEGFSDAVMTAHLIHSQLEPAGLPTSLSPTVVTTMLRDQLNFQGLIITDDLQMKAITDHYGYKEAVQRAIIAGSDLLIVGNNLVYDPDALAQGEAAIHELLEAGSIEARRIQESLERIATLKAKIQGKQQWGLM